MGSRSWDVWVRARESIFLSRSSSVGIPHFCAYGVLYGSLDRLDALVKLYA
jgi:hypothetical protein